MAQYKEINDLYFSGDGDFFLGDNGDLEDTADHNYRGFMQRILTRVMSARGDWALQPTVGASLSSFVGRPNNRELGEAIKGRIFSELAQERLIRAGELVVDVVPVSDTSIMIVLFITPPRSSSSIILNFTYDMRDNQLIPRNI